MRAQSFLILAAIGFSTLLSDCSCTHLCPNPAPEINFVNFDSSQLNVIVLKSYARNGSFNQLQSTAIYTNRMIPGPDTLQTYVNKIFLDYASSTDYIVEVPAVGKSWKIMNVSVHPEKMATSTCTSGMSYILNDTLHSAPAVPYVSDSMGLIKLYR